MLCASLTSTSINVLLVRPVMLQGSSLAVVRRVAQQVLVTLRFLLRCAENCLFSARACVLTCVRCVA